MIEVADLYASVVSIRAIVATDIYQYAKTNVIRFVSTATTSLHKPY